MKKDKITSKNINPLDVLSPPQKLFVEYYTKGNDKIESYIKAYNPKTTDRIECSKRASNILNNAKIIVAINYIKASELKLIEQDTSYNVTVTKVLNEFSKIAFANVKDLFNEDGSPKNVNELTHDIAAAIKDIRTIKDMTTNKVYTEIKLHSKVDALINIAKHLGFYEVDNLQSKANINIANLDSSDLVKLLEIQNKVQ